ncbi:hypothetical protein MHBO_005290 [Bonamia ostreae]|uniref:Uncharacterized protein n=1 Tax=Bonamia ostreae TaxID=126728 RepID=A0ABV2AIJ7_9EUKA
MFTSKILDHSNKNGNIKKVDKNKNSDPSKIDKFRQNLDKFIENKITLKKFYNTSILLIQKQIAEKQNIKTAILEITNCLHIFLSFFNQISLKTDIKSNHFVVTNVTLYIICKIADLLLIINWEIVPDSTVTKNILYSKITDTYFCYNTFLLKDCKNVKKCRFLYSLQILKNLKSLLTVLWSPWRIKTS